MVIDASYWKSYSEWKESKDKKDRVKRKKKKKKHDIKTVLSSKERYISDLQSPLWEKKRQVILERDGYKCLMCGSKYNLQVHHTKYSKDKKPWEYPNINLLTLCKECHKKVHADKNHELNPYSVNHEEREKKQIQYIKEYEVKEREERKKKHEEQRESWKARNKAWKDAKRKKKRRGM